MTRRPRPRLCELPLREPRDRYRTFARASEADGTCLYTVWLGPKYRWIQLEPGASRAEAAAELRKNRAFLKARSLAKHRSKLH